MYTYVYICVYMCVCVCVCVYIYIYTLVQSTYIDIRCHAVYKLARDETPVQ